MYLFFLSLSLSSISFPPFDEQVPPISLYDVQHAPFLLSTSMAPLVAAVIIPPCTLNTVIPEFLRRVVYGNPRFAAINIPANTKIAALAPGRGR